MSCNINFFFQNIPSQYAFDSSTPAYTTTDELVRIEKDKLVRVRIIGLEFKSHHVVCMIKL